MNKIKELPSEIVMSGPGKKRRNVVREKDYNTNIK